MLLLDEAHAAFIKTARRQAARARRSRWRSSSSSSSSSSSATKIDSGTANAELSASNEVAFTTFAPTKANGTPGIYYARYLGCNFPRRRMLQLIAQDLDEGRIDENGNVPCINEVFKKCHVLAPFVDLDLKFRDVDADWLRRYGAMLMTVLLEVATFQDGRGAKAEPIKLYVTTTLGDAGTIRPVQCDIWSCPFCKNTVAAAANCLQLWTCRVCNAKWRTEDDEYDIDSDEGSGEDGGADGGVGCGKRPTLTFRLCAKGNHPSAAKADDGGMAAMRQRSAARAAGESTKRTRPQPTKTTTFKMGAHFRFSGVSMQQHDLIEFMRIVQARSKTFDGRISPAEWDAAVDDAPAHQLNLRLPFMDKAVMCPTCKGRRQMRLQGMEGDMCLDCFGSGRLLKGKIYNVWDVLCHGRHKRTNSNKGLQGWLSEAVADKQPGARELQRRCRDDRLFALQQCSIACVGDDARLVSVRPNNAIPFEAPSLTVTGRVRRNTTEQQHHWKQSQRMAKVAVDPRRYEFLHTLLCDAEPAYDHTFIPDNGAFYIDRGQTTIIVHLDGEGSTFCLNKAAQHPKEPFHDTSRAYAIVRPTGLRFKCFCKKTAHGCDDWAGSRWFPLSRAAVQLLFPTSTAEELDAATVLDEHETRNLTNESLFLQSLAAHTTHKETQRCLRVLQNNIDIINTTSRACIVHDRQHPHELVDFIKFFDAAGCTVKRSKCAALRKAKKSEKKEHKPMPSLLAQRLRPTAARR
jgi:hypothetical protein